MAAALLIGVVTFAWQAKVARDQRDIAVQARESELIAKQQVEKRLGQIVKANEIMTSVVKDLNPQEVAQSGRPLQAVLVEHLDQAASELDGDAIGDPLVVAGMQMDLGAAFEGLGEAGKAVPLIEKARATFAATLGADHTETLTETNDLAMACFAAGDEAKAHAARRLQRFEGTCGRHPAAGQGTHLRSARTPRPSIRAQGEPARGRGCCAAAVPCGAGLGGSGRRVCRGGLGNLRADGGAIVDVLSGGSVPAAQ